MLSTFLSCSHISTCSDIFIYIRENKKKRKKKREKKTEKKKIVEKIF